MAPRVVIIGGASLQWVPKLFLDIVNTPSLTESEIVLQDINAGPLISTGGCNTCSPLAAAVRILTSLLARPFANSSTAAFKSC